MRCAEFAQLRSLDTIETALAALAAGGMAVVVADGERENEGDLILAAALATPEAIAFMVHHTSGVLCAPMPGAELNRLQLPRVPTRYGEFRVIGYRDEISGTETLALVFGVPGRESVLAGRIRNALPVTPSARCAAIAATNSTPHSARSPRR